jgi:hypothetical protein
MKIAFGILTFLIIVASCLCQSTSTAKKPAQKTEPHPRSSFVCPDPEAKSACKSYEELLLAHDSALPLRGYVCFRKKEDDIFTISFSKPYFQTRWDPELKKSVTDPDQKIYGNGVAQTYRDGVQDSSVMPSVIFGGKWAPFGWGDSSEGGIFVSDTMNFKAQDEKDTDTGVSIDGIQLVIGYKYKNKFDKGMTYSLTIQRSTGRFSEYFQEESEKIPSTQGTGYCVFRGVH